MVESNIFEYLPRDILELSAKENSSDFEDINHEDELIDYYYQEEECENVNENYNDQNYVKVIIANSNESNNEEKNKKKVPIFKIEKVKRNKKRRRKPRTIPDIEGCFIPKEKHLNVEKKKNRIQYQKNHQKIIYSYISLTPPINFSELFEMVKIHQMKNSFEERKSFHFIRDIHGKVKIVTFKEKQRSKQKMKKIINNIKKEN